MVTRHSDGIGSFRFPRRYRKTDPKLANEYSRDGESNLLERSAEHSEHPLVAEVCPGSIRGISQIQMVYALYFHGSAKVFPRFITGFWRPISIFAFFGKKSL